VDGGPTHPPNPAGRRALEQEYEQATDAAGAVEDDRTTSAWLLGRVHGRHHVPQPVVATMSPRNPNGSGVPTGRSTIRLWERPATVGAVHGAALCAVHAAPPVAVYAHGEINSARMATTAPR